jgi:pilus assembly protein CpaE
MNLAQDEPAVILLFTADPTLAAVESSLQARGLAAIRVATMEEARSALASHRRRSIAMLDAAWPVQSTVDVMHRLLYQSPPVPTLLLVHEKNESLLHEIDVSAFDDYVWLPMPVDQLVLRLEVLRRRVGQSSPMPSPIIAPALRGRCAPRGEVVIILGPKGGVGRSTIAVNLAVGLAQLHGKTVGLVDADLWFGDVAVLLDVEGERSIAALVDAGEHLESDMLRAALVEHVSGVHVLQAPPKLEQVETIAEDLPARVVNVSRTTFDFTVVDMPTDLDEYALQLLDIADRVVLITTPELSSIRSTAKVLKLPPSLGWRNKLVLVLNRADSGVQLQELEKALGMRVDVSIASAGHRLVDAANRGQPLLLSDSTGKERITRDLRRLVAQIVGEPAPCRERKSSKWPQPLARLGWTSRAASPVASSPV